jgi:hypothetical protein
MQTPEEYAKKIFQRLTTDKFEAVPDLSFGEGVKVEFDGYDRAGIAILVHAGPMYLKEGREFVRAVQAAQDYAEEVDMQLKRLWEKNNERS